MNKKYSYLSLYLLLSPPLHTHTHTPPSLTFCSTLVQLLLQVMNLPSQFSNDLVVLCDVVGDILYILMNLWRGGGGRREELEVTHDMSSTLLYLVSHTGTSTYSIPPPHTHTHTHTHIHTHTHSECGKCSKGQCSNLTSSCLSGRVVLVENNKF